jgi:erythromycin esterase
MSIKRPFILFPFAAALFLISCTERPHPVEQERLAALVPHLTVVRSIAPNDSDFSDLQPLKNILEGKRIVMLGEQSHGDGAAFLAKARLMKFLHREMGFDVFAIESGLFDCEYAGSLIARGVPVREALKKSVFDIWTDSREFQPVIDYLQQSQHTDRPMRFTGFDLQVTGPYGRDSSVPLLRRFLQNLPEQDTGDAFVLQILDTLTKRPKRFAALDTSIRTRFYRSAERLTRRIESSAAMDKAFFAQDFRSKTMLARFLWNVNWNKPDPAVMNLRDEQMAKNLLWLSRERYPGKKIIVWAASSHISRNRQEIIGRNNDDSRMVPMGHHVWSEMGDSVYTLGFTAYEGTMGLRHRNGTVLARARPGTLEDILHHTGNEYSMLDFRTLPDEHWLQDTVRARPYGYSTMLARWPKMMDGMFYIQTMTPSQGVEQE